MPPVTVTATSIIWIEVLGAKPDKSQANREDGGIIDQLQEFLHAAGIAPLRAPLGITSTGRYCHAFPPAVAPQVLAWLRDHGAEQITSRPGGGT